MADIQALYEGRGARRRIPPSDEAEEAEEEDGADGDRPLMWGQPLEPLRLSVQMSEPIRTPADLFTPVDDGYRAWRKSRFAVTKQSEDVCYLCRYGDRIVDAGGSGSQLLGKMFRLVEQYHTTKSGPDLVSIIRRYIDEKIRPALASARRPVILPEFDATGVLEHITTGQHSTNSRMLCSNVPRFLERIMLQASDYIFPKTGGVDTHVMESVRKYAETIFKYHNVKPARLAFGASRPDSINLDLDTPVASAVTTRQIRDTQPVFVSKFLTHHAEKERPVVDDDADMNVD